MRTRTKALLFLACLFLAGVHWVILHGREPFYQGKPLSYYVRMNDPYIGGKQAERAEAAKAISRFGTNAIPLLVQWMQFQESPFALGLRATLPDKVVGYLPYSRHTILANCSIHAFRALGPAVDQAIPSLAQLATNSQSDDITSRAIYALAYTGNTNALCPLFACIEDTSIARHYTAADAFRHVWKSPEPAVPILIARLNDTNPVVARSAAYTLGVLKMKPDSVVPALAEAMDNTNDDVQAMAAAAMAEYGPAAKAGVPALLKATKSSNTQVRFSATGALHEIELGKYANLSTNPP